MQSRARLGLSLLPLLASLLVPACKTVEKDEDMPAASAAPPPSVATADPLPAATTVAPPTPVAPTPTPTPTTTTKLDAGLPVDAGAVVVDAGKPVDAGAAAANGTFKACSEKCQAVLVGCALPQIGKDGGLPTVKDPAACQAAANACIAACTP